MKDLKPTTCIYIIILFVCAVALTCQTLAVMAVLSHNHALEVELRSHKAKIETLQVRIIQLSTMNDLMLVFDYLLPPMYSNEIAIINKELRERLKK